MHVFDEDSDASDDGELDTIIANEIKCEGGGPSSLIPLPDPLSAKQTLLECESKDLVFVFRTWFPMVLLIQLP